MVSGCRLPAYISKTKAVSSYPATKRLRALADQRQALECSLWRHDEKGDNKSDMERERVKKLRYSIP